MAKRPHEGFTPRFLNEACQRVGITGRDRVDPRRRLLGVSERLLTAYRTTGATPACDRSLSAVFAALLVRADAKGIGLPVRLLLHQAIGRRPVPLADQPIELVNAPPGLGGPAAGGDEPFPLSAAVLGRDAASCGLGGDDAFANLMHWADRQYARRDFAAAAELFERAVAWRPADVAAPLCAVKSHLQATEGDLPSHWRRADALIAARQPAFAEASAAWVEWEFWRVIATTRNADQADPAATFLAAAAALAGLADHARRAGDREMGLTLASLRSAALFRSGLQPGIDPPTAGATPGQVQAIAAYKQLLKTLRQRHDAYRRAVALKRLANCYALLPTGGPTVPEQRARRAHVKNLRRSVDGYRAACEALGKARLGPRRRRIEEAMCKYSEAAALGSIGQLTAGPGRPRVVPARPYYSAAAAAANAAIKRFPADHVDDLIRAWFTLGDICRSWPYDDRTVTGRWERGEYAGRAVHAYQACLGLLARVSAPDSPRVRSEVAWTRYPLGQSHLALALAGLDPGRNYACAVTHLTAAHAELVDLGEVTPAVLTDLNAARDAETKWSADARAG